MDRNSGVRREQEVLASRAAGPQSSGINEALAMWPAGRGSADAMSGGQGSRLLVGQLPQTLPSSWQEAEALKRVSNSSLQTLPPSAGGSVLECTG